MEYITLHADEATLFFYFILFFSLCLQVLTYRPLYLSNTSCSALCSISIPISISHSCIIHCISQLHDFSISPTPYLSLSPTPSLFLFNSLSLNLLLSLPLYHTFIISSFLLPFPYFESDIYMSIIQSSSSTYFTDYIPLFIYMSLSLPLTNGSFNSPASVQTKAHTDLERLSSVESETRLVAISSRRYEMCEGKNIK